MQYWEKQNADCKRDPVVYRINVERYCYLTVVLWFSCVSLFSKLNRLHCNLLCFHERRFLALSTKFLTGTITSIEIIIIKIIVITIITIIKYKINPLLLGSQWNQTGLYDNWLYDGIMRWGLLSVNSIIVDFLNQIRYFSIK